MDNAMIVDFLSTTIRVSTPILMGTLACTISEKAGVINIGIEGMMALCAFASAAVAFLTENAWLGVLGGMLMGAVLCYFLALLSIYCDGAQVIVGIGINTLGSGAAVMGMMALWGNRGTSPWLPGLEAWEIPVVKDIPFIGPIVSGHNPVIYIGWLSVIIMSYVLYRTVYGLRLRAAGEHPTAVETVGVNVYRLRSGALVLGGLLIGLGGASLCLGSVNILTNGIVANRGYLAFAANRFGQWSPVGSYFASFLFGAMEVLRMRLQEYGIPPQFLQMLPYVITLIALGMTAKRSRAPAALGVQYPHPIALPHRGRGAAKSKLDEPKNKMKEGVQ